MVLFLDNRWKFEGFSRKFAGPVPSVLDPGHYYPFPITLSQLPYYPLHYPYPYPFTLSPFCPLYPLHCILYTIHFITVSCTLYTVYFTHVHCIQCTLHSILYTLYTCILLLIFYRAHGCLGAAPVSLGPPPQGSWGASRGGGALKSAGRSLPNPLGFRIEISVDFDVGFWSFGGRSWVPLGGHFRSSWRLFRPKLVSEPSSNRLIFEKVIFH